MKKKWHELTESGKRRRLNKARSILDDECLTIDFWQEYDRKHYNKARQILIQNIDYSKKLGYHYAKNNDDVNNLLTYPDEVRSVSSRKSKSARNARQWKKNM